MEKQALPVEGPKFNSSRLHFQISGIGEDFSISKTQSATNLTTTKCHLSSCTHSKHCEQTVAEAAVQEQTKMACSKMHRF